MLNLSMFPRMEDLQEESLEMVDIEHRGRGGRGRGDADRAAGRGEARGDALRHPPRRQPRSRPHLPLRPPPVLAVTDNKSTRHSYSVF